ncbi:hypothetical protein [Bacillus sp. S/N-304-OC-R1]|uniref:hypothetical protein n=1 Tax=Bacillus sp. S/N-304-OC-R1 TaxID=2758034 RepID=UPI001C8D195E|nr:hypothetical protein [Bacillus sp. S/N-304-OC-R1]MBY0122628.1 hypothetical protein [Bacillus sp. S/N-304-OC-R1]
MKKNTNAKEELVNMLSEIYQQLEELENVLDSNFSSIRNHWQDQYTDQLSVCDSKLDLLERETMRQVNGNKPADKETFQRSPGIKLELGYKLH